MISDPHPRQWAVGGHHWKGGKGPEPRDGHRPDGRDGRHHASVVEREGPVRGARGAPARHHGSHAERVEREWNDWEEAKWDECLGVGSGHMSWVRG